MHSYIHNPMPKRDFGLMFPLASESRSEQRSVNAWSRLARQHVTRCQVLNQLRAESKLDTFASCLALGAGVLAYLAYCIALR